MQKTRAAAFKTAFLCAAIGLIVAVYFYVEREKDLIETQRSGDGQTADLPSDQSPSQTAIHQPLPRSSAVRNELLALRAKLARQRDDEASQSKVPTEELTPEQSQQLKALQRTFNRSLAGQYSRRQIHIAVKSIRQMFADSDCPAVATDANATIPANLSWRVHLLPYIGEQDLYEQFHLNEPWDSLHNQTLLVQMPMLYRGLYDKPDATDTRLMSLNIPGAFGRGGRLRPLSDVSDPEFDTLAIIIVGTKLAVPWTSPQDFTTTADTFRDAMSVMPTPTYWVGTVEGAALDVRVDGQFKTFNSLMTIAGGEPNSVDAMVKEKFQLMKSDGSRAD